MALAIIFITCAFLEITTSLGFTEIYTDALWDNGLGWIKGYWVASIEFSIGSIFIIVSFLKGDATLSHKILESMGRVAMGIMFIGASIFKISDPQAFAELSAQYQMLPQAAINIFSLFLPVLEFIVGVLIVFSPKTKQNAALILGMMGMFIIALVWAVGNDLGITCGCFGGIEGAMDKSEAWVSLVRDIVLLPILIYLTTRPKNQYIWRVWA